MKDIHSLGPTVVHEFSVLCEDGDCETAGKDFVQGKRAERNGA